MGWAEDFREGLRDRQCSKYYKENKQLLRDPRPEAEEWQDWSWDRRGNREGHSTHPEQLPLATELGGSHSQPK